MSDEKKTALLKAMCQVSAACGKVAKDDWNKHGAYKFASVDAFLAAVGPPMAETGLVCMAEQDGAEIVERLNQYGKLSNWERSKWLVSIHHVDGGVFGPVARIVELPLSGAQTNGSAQSYVQKVVYRSVFNIPTGEPDGEAYALSESTPTLETKKPAQKLAREDDRALFSTIQAEARKAEAEADLTALYRQHQADIQASKWSGDILDMLAAEKARVKLATQGIDGEVVL